uniref:Protein kinase domain-containing protein n=1 Tax=Arcella intermedia TaxID=1963864 RepID=A0A6B2LDK6_9EUKA
MCQRQYTRVYYGRSKELKFEVAIKEAKKRKGFKSEIIKNKSNLLKKMDHPYLVKIYDIFDAEESLYVVMELVKGGSIQQYVVDHGKFNEENAKQIIRKVLTTLEYIHSLDMVYKYLKPDRILFESEVEPGTHIKIISDIEFSNIYTQDLSILHCFAHEPPYYTAPEMLEGSGWSKGTDMWSVGSILYLMLSGEPPFCYPGTKEHQIYDFIKKADYMFDSPLWDDISQEAKDLISQLLVVDSNQRLSSTQSLGHPWLKT